MAACYRNDIAITPRGGGSGVAGGAVPDGGVVISLERLNRIRSFDPLVWRIQVEAGVTTGRLHQVARESGLMFPPDPGASEQSQIGGNLATNAGGPHAFRYGVTRRWVTGIEAVIAPGELITVGGPVRKDVAGYDLLGLLVGSEGTLGLITAAWLRLVPAPEAVHVVAGVYPTDAAACAAIERILGSGIEAAAIELLDAAAMRFGGGGFPAETRRWRAGAGRGRRRHAGGGGPSRRAARGDGGGRRRGAAGRRPRGRLALARRASPRGWRRPTAASCPRTSWYRSTAWPRWWRRCRGSASGTG